MEPKKTIFNERPALIEPEGPIARINFDIEEKTEVVNQSEGAEQEETRTIFLAHIVRVEQPLTFDRIKAALVEAGFDDDKSEEQAALTLLAEVQAGKPVGNAVELARKVVLARISAYDKSDAVNQFTLNGVPMWLDDATRTKLAKRFDTDEKDGKTETKLIYGGVPFALPIETAKGLLHQLESYARDCFDQTNVHKAAVAALDDESAILNYDFTAGYPPQPAFGETNE